MSLFLLGVTAAWAGSYTIPNSFTSGTAAVAAEVNANFSAAKAAIDDNDSRVTTLESVSGSTSYLSIPARGGFVANLGGNTFASCFPDTFAWNGTGSSLFQAMVNLPHNSVITDFTYHYWTVSFPSVQTTATLYRQPMPATSREQMAAVASTSTSSGGHINGSTTAITNGTVDNQSYTYYVETDLPATGSLCTDGITITYTKP